MRTYRLLLGALVGVIELSGCGLVSDDTANVDLAALQKPFTIDAAAWNLNPTSAVVLMGRTCAPGAVPDPCTAQVIASSVCKLSLCTSACNPDTSQCQLTLRTELWRTINLATDLPNLTPGSPDDDVLEVMLDDVTYEVPQNSFNVSTAELTVYLAPTSVTSPGGDGAMPIGSIRSIEPGSDSPRRSLDLHPNGKELVRRRLSEYQIPFNLILGSELLLDAGAALPAGRIDAIIGLEGRAGRS